MHDPYSWCYSGVILLASRWLVTPLVFCTILWLFYGSCNTVCTSMVLQIKFVIDVVGFSYNARPAIIRVWIFDIQTAVQRIVFRNTRRRASFRGGHHVYNKLRWAFLWTWGRGSKIIALTRVRKIGLHKEGCRTQNLVNHNPRRSMLSSRRRGGTPGPGGRAQSARRENTKYRHWARRQRRWKKSYGARDCSQAFFFFTLRSALICRPFLASLEI